MKLLLDMNLSPWWIDVLSDAGIEAAHWSLLGAKNAPDAEIMAYAGANDPGLSNRTAGFQPDPAVHAVP